MGQDQENKADVSAERGSGAVGNGGNDEGYNSTASTDSTKSNEAQIRASTLPQHKRLINIAKLPRQILFMRWLEYPLREFVFTDVYITFYPDSHVRSTHFKIDLDGNVSIRMRPTATWWEVAQAISQQYEWITKNLTRIHRSYDAVTYLAQKHRNFTDGELIFIWGKPYVLSIQMGAPEVSVERTEPVQTLIARVPVGVSRYAERFYALARKGYLNPEALRSLPLIVKGSIMQPKHCQWQDIQGLNYKASDLHEINLFYSEFTRTQASLIKDWQERRFFSSRFLSNPSRQMCLCLFEANYEKYVLRQLDRSDQNVALAATMADASLEQMSKSIFSGSIVSHPYCNEYYFDPLLSPNPEQTIQQELQFSFNRQENMANQVGIRANNPPVRIHPAPIMDYYELPDSYRLADIITQRALYVPENSDIAREAQKRQCYCSLVGSESTLVTITGHEIDPAEVLIAYLPDNPELANYDPKKLGAEQIEQLTTGTFVNAGASVFIGKHEKTQLLPFFHNTLVKPGVLTLKLRGHKRPGPDFIRRQLEMYLDEELKEVAANFLRGVEPVYRCNLRRIASKYNVVPWPEDQVKWFDRLEIKKMQPLGQCRWDRGVNTLRINRRIVHYPINVLAALINHEICHLPFHIHNKYFKVFLDMQSPGADFISDSIINIGILPLA